MATSAEDIQIAADKKKRLDDLMFYAIDKASPYALAFHPNTNSLDKISGYTLSGLSLTDQGSAMMWLWINAHCQPDAKPVGADVASKCKKVAEVRTAVYKNAA